jgi:hypothetical protein
MTANIRIDGRRAALARQQTVLDRADKRGYGPSFTREKVFEFWNKIDEFRHTRPSAIQIDAETAAPEEIAGHILSTIKTD